MMTNIAIAAAVNDQRSEPSEYAKQAGGHAVAHHAAIAAVQSEA